MPIKRTKGGFRYGTTGKVYKSRKKALKQARAINLSKSKRK